MKIEAPEVWQMPPVECSPEVGAVFPIGGNCDDKGGQRKKFEVR